MTMGRFTYERMTMDRLTLVLLCTLELLSVCEGFAFSFGPHPGEWSQFNTASLDGALPVQTRSFSTACVPIPHNMSLCQGLEYSRMRLPNLLDHDTIDEVLEQSSSWVHLKKLKCHADTQKFLCSLFAPVCLETPIFPCRSLCEQVRSSCESSMLKFGYPWPEMVNCDKFPEDDMCVTAGDKDDGGSAICRACSQPINSESLLDNYCRADFVIRARARRGKDMNILKTKMSRIFKVTENIISKKDLRSPEFRNANMSECCGGLDRKILKRNPHLLIMGTKDGDGNLVPTFLMEWKRGSEAFKKSIKKMQKINCAHPSIVDNNPLDPVTGRKQSVHKKDHSEEVDSTEVKKEQPKVQFDLSENFRREMELHNIAAQQEKAKEQQAEAKREREKKRKERRRKEEGRKHKTEASRVDPDEEGEEPQKHKKQRPRNREHKRKTTTTTEVSVDEDGEQEAETTEVPTSTEIKVHRQLTYHKEMDGEIEMIVDPPTLPKDEIKIEKKIDHEIHHHKKESINEESHHRELHHHHDSNLKNNEPDHEKHTPTTAPHHHHHEPSVIPSDEQIIKLVDEDSPTKTHHHHHKTKIPDEQTNSSGDKHKVHEIRHEEHLKHHQHDEETTTQFSKLEDDTSFTMAPVKEDFITVLPAIPDDMKTDLVEEETTTELEIVEKSVTTTEAPTTLMTSSTSTTETSSPEAVPTSPGKRGRKRKNGRRRHHKKKKDEEPQPQEAEI